MARTSIGPHAGHITVMVVGGLCRLAKLWSFWWPDLPTLPGWGFLSSRTTHHLTHRTSWSDTFGAGFKPSGNYCHAKWNFSLRVSASVQALMRIQLMTSSAWRRAVVSASQSVPRGTAILRLHQVLWS